MDSRRVSKGISSHNCLVRLHRHVHQVGNHTAQRINLRRIDICLKINVIMRLYYHRYLFEGGVSRPFADSVDGNFALACSVDESGHRVGRRHSQVVVTVGRDDGLVDIADIVAEIFDLGSIFRRKAVAGGIGNVDDRCTSCNHSLHDSCKVLIISPSGIFGIELDLIHEVAGIFHCLDGTLDDFLTSRIELVADVRIRSADSGVDSLVLCKFKSLDSDIDVLLHSPCQGADCRPGHSLGNLNHRIEIPGA